MTLYEQSTMHLRKQCAPIILVLLFSLALLSSCAPRPVAEPFATGLSQPRGMAFDATGNLFVAEAGALAPGATSNISPQINHSSRVVRIAPDGHVTTVLDNLPYTNYVEAGDTGAADVAFIGNTLYALIGEGYDDQLSRMVLRVQPGAPPQPVANLRRFAEGTVPMAEQMISAGPPSNPDAMVAAPDGSVLYVADGASGRVMSVTPDGRMRIVAELPNKPPMTGMGFGPDGKLYVAMFSRRPHAPGSGEIWTIDSANHAALSMNDLTMPIAVRFDSTGAMYVLEFSDGRQPNNPYAPNAGRLLRIGHDGAKVVVLDRLNYPTAMAFSRTGDLYIAVNGAFSGPGEGTILKVPCEALGVPDACPAL
jgi:sugar lactone lactonase YvrE